MSVAAVPPRFSAHGVGINLKTGYLIPSLRDGVIRRMNAVEATRVAIAKQRAAGVKVQVPESAAEALRLPNLVEGTCEAPRNAAEIEALLKRLQTKQANEDTPALVLDVLVSAEQLNLIHPGVGVHFPHLHPNQPGLSTGSAEDKKKIRVIWKYRAPVKGEIHPEKLEFTDGRLTAAWLTSEEAGLPKGTLDEFHRHTARSIDFLFGHEGAFTEGAARRLLSGMLYRYKSYFIGLKEGLTDPRFNGRIAANLLVNSLPLSAALYAIFYGVDYELTKHENNKVDKQPNANLPYPVTYTNASVALTT